jgi:hypothetical protein
MLIRDAVHVKHSDQVEAHKLTTLAGVEDIGCAVAADGPREATPLLKVEPE